MREVFGEYYSPNDEEYKKFLTSGLIVLDANVLLAPYRLDSEARNQVFELLYSLRERIWVPYQTGWEFFQNRPNVLSGEDKVYRDLEKPLEDAKGKIEAHLKSLAGHPVVTDDEKVRLIRYLEDAISLVSRLSTNRDEKLENALRSDSVLQKWESILVGRIGAEPSMEVRSTREEAAAERYKKSQPPGYRDEGKKDNQYGDALLWLELLDHIDGSGTPVLMITNDVKEDWYRRQSGRTIGPRVELVREMRDHGSPYYQQRLAAFLERASTLLAKPVSEEAVEQVARSAQSEHSLQFLHAVRRTLVERHPDANAIITPEIGNGLRPDLAVHFRNFTIGVEAFNRSQPVTMKDFRHLPRLMADSGLDALMVVSAGPVSPTGRRRLRDLERENPVAIDLVELDAGGSLEDVAASFDMIINRLRRRNTNSWEK
ncbi:PIN domain-containing protein [Streptomyces sp. NPDC005573]|uniref:PIN domain-containing protein n=1 Tax=Streptomyces sp. NPDC005573 TaxID=3156890 RepID=UPI0033B5A218